MGSSGWVVGDRWSCNGRALGRCGVDVEVACVLGGHGQVVTCEWFGEAGVECADEAE
jgi:hypothetical protein